MITAVDTNVLVDVFGGDPRFGPASKAALDLCIAEGTLVAGDVVWAEITASFPVPEDAGEAMDEAGMADFLIGAHALAQADRLLTRDSRFHRLYFKDLEVLDPAG